MNDRSGRQRDYDHRTDHVGFGVVLVVHVVPPGARRALGERHEESVHDAVHPRASEY